MIHSLLVLAIVLFVIWLIFHAVAAVINLLWIAIIVFAALWVLGQFRGRGTT